MGSRSLGHSCPTREGEGAGHRLTDSRTRSRGREARINNFIYTLHTVCTAQPPCGRGQENGAGLGLHCPPTAPCRGAGKSWVPRQSRKGWRGSEARVTHRSRAPRGSWGPADTGRVEVHGAACAHPAGGEIRDGEDAEGRSRRSPVPWGPRCTWHRALRGTLGRGAGQGWHAPHRGCAARGRTPASGGSGGGGSPAPWSP